MNTPTENRFRVGRLQAEIGTRNHLSGGRIKHTRSERPAPTPSGRRARRHITESPGTAALRGTVLA